MNDETGLFPPAPQPGLLDPADWSGFRREAHALLDRLVDHLAQIGEGPVWRRLPEGLREQLKAPAPTAPEGIAQVCADIGAMVLPYGSGNTHPRFFGWVQGTGTPGGMLAEMAAAALNANCGGRDHGAIYVERTVIAWARQWFGFPDTAAGLLVTGTSMANLQALAAARNHKAGYDLRAEGLKGRGMVAYASAEAHSCVAKAVELLGLGRDALRLIPVDENYRMRLAALKEAVAADREAGRQPFCVVATAGSVNTGSFDDLAAIGAFCRDHGLWLHVDGAFGVLTALDPSQADRLNGLEQADSLAFDFHKWLHVPYDAGCLLVRNGALLRAAFSGRPAYLDAIGGLAGGDHLWPADLGIDLSRGFRALKVWATIKEHGTERLGAAIARNCAQARMLGELVGSSPVLTLMAPVALNIVCLRYDAGHLDATLLDDLNAGIVVELQERGLAAPSTCRLQGRLCIRVCITNHRSQDADFPFLIKAIETVGRELTQG